MRLLAISSALACTLALLPGRAVPDTLISNVTLVDVETGVLVPSQSVWIEGTAIAAVGPDLAAPRARDELTGPAAI